MCRLSFFSGVGVEGSSVQCINLVLTAIIKMNKAAVTSTFKADRINTAAIQKSVHGSNPAKKHGTEVPHFSLISEHNLFCIMVYGIIHGLNHLM